MPICLLGVLLFPYKKFQKFESKISEELDKVHKGVSLIANIEDGDNPMLSKSSASFALDCLLSQITKSLELRDHRNKMTHSMKKARKEVAEDHFAMTLKQLANQAHRMQTQDPTATIDSLMHPLDIFEREFKVEMLIAPEGLIGKIKQIEWEMKEEERKKEEQKMKEEEEEKKRKQIEIDNRGTRAPKGKAWRKSIYGAVGVLSSRDQSDALKVMSERWRYIDTDNVAIWGHSGGGSMTLNMLFRYPEQYKVGISLAPVPDQRLYDSIYQERYSGLLSDYAEGYEQGSPITHAKNLQGKLLMYFQHKLCRFFNF